MKRVFKRQGFLDSCALRRVLGEKRWYRRGQFIKVFHDVITLDMDNTVMDQHRDNASGIDTKKPRRGVLLTEKIDRVGFPRNPLFRQKNPDFLRTRGTMKV